jgi:hypothetical protein
MNKKEKIRLIKEIDYITKHMIEPINMIEEIIRTIKEKH